MKHLDKQKLLNRLEDMYDMSATRVLTTIIREIREGKFDVPEDTGWQNRQPR